MNGAETSPGADDARLRGGTYTIPFEDVWQAALALASGGLARWELASADDESGTIHAEARTLFGRVSDVTIRIGLDADAQTRVDAQGMTRGARRDLGANARHIARFFRALDKRLSQRAPRPPLYTREPRSPTSDTRIEQ
jgi:hypothetical protein